MLNKKDKLKGLKVPKISNNLAYLCGVFAGDGSINFRKNKNEYSIKCVGNPKDEKEFYTQIIAPKFNRVFGFTPEIKERDKKTTFGLVVYSKTLLIYLTQEIGLPLGEKYSSLKIPKKFLKDENLTINFIMGVFDTDGCICFKRKYKNYPYYPTISLSSKSSKFIYEISGILKKWGFNVVETYDYRFKDVITKKGFTEISRLELNGRINLNLWLKKVGFYSPKHLSKIKMWRKERL